ncbi:unnamed protein product, partial [Aphanomyces euteiches]
VAGRMVPRPLEEALHATKPNELIRADFLTLPKDGYTGWTYVLALKDDTSAFCLLIGCQAATAEALADALVH